MLVAAEIMEQPRRRLLNSHHRLLPQNQQDSLVEGNAICGGGSRAVSVNQSAYEITL
jgi:hypothetical protein